MGFFCALVALALCLIVVAIASLTCLSNAGHGSFDSVCYSLAGGILILLMFWNLAKLFNNVVSDEGPFSEKQADCLCAIAVVALTYFILDVLFSFGFVLEPAPEIGFGMVANDGVAEPTINLNIGMLAFSAIMYSLSAIFRYAALLQQLSDETV